MKTPLVSVIIINWNGKKLLRDCLRSLSGQSFKGFRIIVVDNGSTDGSIEFLHSHYPKIRIIRFEKNLGFAKAANHGIKASSSKYIVLLNNDTKADSYYLERMTKILEKWNKFCGVAPKVLNFFKPDIIDSAGDMMNVVGQAFHRGYGDKSNEWNYPGEVSLITGGASAFRKEIFEKIGLFDEDFFAYGEDVDWCLRAWLAGYKFWYEPKAIVYHHHKATAQRIPKIIEYLQFRNMTLIILKNFPWRLFFKRWRFITIPLIHFNTILYMAFHGLLKEALLADWWILTHLSHILKKRWKIQRIRKVNVNYLDSQMAPKKIRLWGLLK